MFLSEKQIAKLKELSEKSGLPYSEFVRRAIDQFLKVNK